MTRREKIVRAYMVSSYLAKKNKKINVNIYGCTAYMEEISKTTATKTLSFLIRRIF